MKRLVYWGQKDEYKGKIWGWASLKIYIQSSEMYTGLLQGPMVYSKMGFDPVIEQAWVQFWEVSQKVIGLPPLLPHTHTHTHTQIFVPYCMSACLCLLGDEFFTASLGNNN